MKAKNEKNWIKILPIAVSLLNKRNLSKLGGIAPDQISSFLDDSVVRTAQAASGLETDVPDGFIFNII